MTGIADRIYGGIGVALDSPSTEVTIEEIQGAHVIELPHPEAIPAVRGLIDKLHIENTFVRIRVLNAPEPHHGLGSKTALLLSIAAGLSRLFDLGLSPTQLILATGRGGASGVGSWSFFYGGVIVDAGRPLRDVHSILPSSAATPSSVPLMIERLEFPQSWRIALLDLPGREMVGINERHFFQQRTPIPRTESLEAIALAHHSIIPAIVSNDLIALSSGLRLFHRVGFKRLELNAQAEIVRSCLDDLWIHNILASGMSSMGPLVYAVYDSDSSGRELIDAVAERRGIAAHHVAADASGAYFSVSS